MNNIRIMMIAVLAIGFLAACEDESDAYMDHKEEQFKGAVASFFEDDTASSEGTEKELTEFEEIMLKSSEEIPHEIGGEKLTEEDRKTLMVWKTFLGLVVCEDPGYQNCVTVSVCGEKVILSEYTYSKIRPFLGGYICMMGELLEGKTSQEE